MLLVVSPVNPWDTSESVLKSPKNFVHEALDTFFCIVLEPRPWKYGSSPIPLVRSIAYRSFPSQSNTKVVDDYPKPTSRQDFQLQCLGWESLYKANRDVCKSRRNPVKSILTS